MSVLTSLLKKLSEKDDVLRFVYLLVESTPLQRNALQARFPLSLTFRNSGVHLINMNKNKGKIPTPLHITVRHCSLHLFYSDYVWIYPSPGRQTDKPVMMQGREINFSEAVK